MAPLSTTVDPTTSNSSPSGSHTTRLTPDTDSEDSDLDFGRDELGHGIELRQRDSEKAPDEDGEIHNSEQEGHAGARFKRRRTSASTTQSFQLYTPDEERAVVRKFDRRLVLFVHVLYMLSFLDRSSGHSY